MDLRDRAAVEAAPQVEGQRFDLGQLRHATSLGARTDKRAASEDDEAMTAARSLTSPGSIFLDPRGSDRALRVSWHQEAEVVVLSLWRDNVCSATFRLAIDEVPDLIALLREGLDLSFMATRVDRSA